jgi:hypothetical protein
MQGGASRHATLDTQIDLQERGIRILKWLAFSPDLDPIETAWYKTKAWIQKKLRRERLKYTPNYDQARCLVWADWDAIGVDLLAELVASMTDRL